MQVRERSVAWGGYGCVCYSFQSDAVQPYGRAKAGTRTGGVGLRKKPKDLSVSEREERGHGRAWVCMLLCCCSDIAGIRTVVFGLHVTPIISPRDLHHITSRESSFRTQRLSGLLF